MGAMIDRRGGTQGNPGSACSAIRRAARACSSPRRRHSWCCSPGLGALAFCGGQDVVAPDDASMSAMAGMQVGASRLPHVRDLSSSSGCMARGHRCLDREQRRGTAGGMTAGIMFVSFVAAGLFPSGRRMGECRQGVSLVLLHRLQRPGSSTVIDWGHIGSAGGRRPSVFAVVAVQSLVSIAAT